MDATICNGVPYGPDIKILQEAWPVPALIEGLVITHEQFAQALGYGWKSSRFYAVIRAWCHREYSEHGIFMAWEQKIGLRVLDPASKLLHGEGRIRGGLRRTKRGIKIVASVDGSRLDEMGKKRLDHDRHIAAVLNDALDSAKKQLAIDLAPIKSLPRPLVTG